jgi:hypothetical protein
MIGQIGKAKAATKFLASLRSNADIAPVAFITTGRPLVKSRTPNIIPTDTLQKGLMQRSRTFMEMIGS